MNNAPSKLQHRLKGFSGSMVEVRRLRNCSFVRKTVQSPDQNSKLLAEMDKLVQLVQIAAETKLFYVPELLSNGINDDGLAFYEIEFIPGWELDSQLPRLNPRELDEMATRLCDIITAFSATARVKQDKVNSEMLVDACEVDFILGKLQETRLALQGAQKTCPQTHPLISEYAERVQGLVIPSQCVVGKKTFCHGDLALDNVLIGRDGQLYLIDPLVNGHECFMWDISKVFQSSLACWKQIKHGEFKVDFTRRNIFLYPSERVSLFNCRFSGSVTRKYNPSCIILYLATTIARAAKYWHTCEQLCALLILTNELLDRYANKRYDLNEPFSSLRW